MITRDIKCDACGTEGKLQAHDTMITAADGLFSFLGKDRSGFLHFQCPACSADLVVDPLTMLDGGTLIGHAPNRRYVPIITGLFFSGGGLYLAIGVDTWWSFLLGVVCVMFGWVSIKTGLFASSKEIAELTGFGSVSKETTQKLQDRL